jgi:hypothetical protein
MGLAASHPPLSPSMLELVGLLRGLVAATPSAPTPPGALLADMDDDEGVDMCSPDVN